MSARANRVTEAYLAECATPDSGLRGALAELDVSETMHAAWPRLLPRPVMVDEAEFRAFGRDLVTIFDLVGSLPQRCFDGDFERFRAARRRERRAAAENLEKVRLEKMRELEQVRKRIAADLHDEISARLAASSVRVLISSCSLSVCVAEPRLLRVSSRA